MDEKENLNCSGIYALVCPDTDEIKYVGRSKNIRKRFIYHLYSKKNSTTPVAWWIKSLHEENKRPKCIILETHINPTEVEKKMD